MTSFTLMFTLMGGVIVIVAYLFLCGVGFGWEQKWKERKRGKHQD